MLIKKPIFQLGFARGGSNILLNMLRSHPNVCSPRGETQQLFVGKTDPFLPKHVYSRVEASLRYLPILLRERSHVFSLKSHEKRKSLSPFSQRQIDRILYYDRVRATEPNQNMYKKENIKYSKEELFTSRILCKNLNGLLFLSTHFSAMYPDATFVALIRNGFCVIEGHMRRGMPLEQACLQYQKGIDCIVHDSKTIKNFKIYKYEDLVAEPVKTMKDIYSFCDLDIAEVEKVRLETKSVIGADGKAEFLDNKSEKRLIWYKLEEIPQHIRTDANNNQLKRLSDRQKEQIIKICGKQLALFGYINS